ncbi:hypothetical protein ABZV93_16360 [Actinopolymorpha sp. NPDC004070]|uniref:hypothetical protein n=1 Tax=Actinopolymorpha sp. NPDC004070 TaxID=3154548 RepID=UPI00339DB8DC
MSPAGRTVSRTTVVGVAAAAATVSGLVVGGIALADNASGPKAQVAAQPQATPTASPAPKERGGFGHPGRPGGPGRFGPGGFGGGFGPGGFGPGELGMAGRALHGEFVVAKPGGGYQTVAAQRGTAQSVSSTAVTVKSTDGYTHTYVVDAKTRVNALREGIGSIKQGQQVAVVAKVSGNTSTAVRVVDLADRGTGKQWRQPGQKQAPGPKSGTN